MQQEQPKEASSEYFTVDSKGMVVSLTPACAEDLKVYKQLIEVYANIQHEILLRTPFQQFVKIAKLELITKQNMQDKPDHNRQPDDYNIYAKYYYEGLHEEKIYLRFSDASIKRFDLSKEKDSLFIKQIFQVLVEYFFWASNYGFFLDPSRSQMYVRRVNEVDYFIFLPTIKIFANYLTSNLADKKATVNYRLNIYQHLTAQPLIDLSKALLPLLKELDEDKKFHQAYVTQTNALSQIHEPVDLKKIPNVVCRYGCDDTYAEQAVLKKIWRESFKQSMLLYAMKDQRAREVFKEARTKDAQCVTMKIANQPDSRSLDQNNRDALAQSKNFYEMLRKLSACERGLVMTDQDVATKYLEFIAVKDLLPSDEESASKKLKACFKPKFPEKLEGQLKFEVPKLEQIPQESFFSQVNEVKAISLIRPSNLIFSVVNASAKVEQQNKLLTMSYKVELLETKLCYIFKTTIPEIPFQIESADDLMFMVNMLQKENGATNLYIDDQRKLTIYTTIVQGINIEIIPAFLKIFDIHVIYFYMLVEFFQKNIAAGRSIKEDRYQQFVREVLHRVAEYELDFEAVLAKLEKNEDIVWF